ncbi:unnamed protein product [Cercopithifilaria johnstoni]|uniref:Vezatin n=1 Tax=Cercopithifilaria johnstoni TaxID=2874296 RepID=A0A8J2Q888_9BILA|nr:unnamed protein product [Cercopithifilaria johnstoni]
MLIVLIVRLLAYVLLQFNKVLLGCGIGLYLSWMSSSGFFWQVYQLLLEKSLLDVTDLEVVEEHYLTSEWKALISSKSVSCISVIATVIACGLSASHQILGLLVFPALFIGLVEATKRFCYYIVSSYASVSADFDSVSHRIVAAIRSREVAFFGLRKKFDMNPTVCLRSFRLELLKALRCEVQYHVHMTRNLCRYNDSELLCEMFTLEMSRLALEDNVCEEFLQLSALKELWQLLFLLRSEHLRLFLLHLSCPSRKLILIFLDLFRETLLLRNSTSKLLCSLEFINYRDCCAAEKKIRKISPFLSTAEKILAHLSFASEILNGNEIPEEEKLLYVTEILREAIELSAPKTHIEREDIKHSNMSSNSSVSEGTDDNDSAADELPVEKLYEGFSLVSDDQQKDVFLSSWQKSESNEALARSVVVELKSRLVERIREMDAAKAEKTDYSQQMATVGELQEALTVDENCDAEKTADREDFNIFSSISKNNGIFQSNIKLDLKQAISLVKLGPSVDFMDDPGNVS